MSLDYSDAFFRDLDTGSARAAAVVAPLFLSLFPIASVVDIGCGTGAWLEAFAVRGVGDHVGVDGPYVPLDLLRIGHDRFVAADLSRPLALGRVFDAALCLEVAEHLPPEAADTLIATLTAAAPVILFSAAIPFQGGTDHVNEQWPSYWAERFAAAGFLALDIIRPPIQWDERVAFWYRQNTLVFCRPEKVPAGVAPVTYHALLNRVDLPLYGYLKSTVDALPKG